MLTNALEEVSLNSHEYCYNLTKMHESTTYWQIHLPKLMPLIPQGKAKTVKATFNNKIFINDKPCMPTANKQTYTQNYLTVNRYRNTNFGHKSDKYGFIHPGAKFIIGIMDKNVRDMRLTDRE